MKSFAFVIMYFSLGVFVNLFYPHLVTAKYCVDNELCMTCHAHSDFVSYHNGYDCSICHYNGSSVTAENCSTCHFSIGQDEAILVDYHEGMGADCFSCHVSSHIETCLVCHNSDDIHGREGHFPCSKCHAAHGGMKKIQPDKCIECHPLVDPGKCNVAGYHGDLCLECHTECVEDASTTTTVPPGHMGICLGCHSPDDLHFKEKHSDCAQCHHGEVVEASSCTACHPADDPATCGIVSIHGSSCLECHFACGDTTHMDICLGCHLEDILHGYEGHEGGNCAQCHDSESGGGQVDVGRCSSCHPDEDPGECNLAHRHSTRCIGCHTDCADGPTTTTSVPSGHTGICLQCHSPNALHFDQEEGHQDCDQCHQGGDVGASACSACHPASNPGTCSLASYHGSTCLNCHVMCADSTTTTTPGEPTPTTVPPFAHREICLVCHATDDLHEGKGHSSLSCGLCHEDGRGQSGNVEPESCSACHPTGDPGKCNLARLHGPATCLKCHQADCREDETTTTIEPTTTTSSPYFIHSEICMECHNVNDLHEHVGHDNCTHCHEGTPQAGNVDPGTCIVCHPGGDTGFCNLVTHHGGSCLECHSECVDETTTTTTTNIPPAVIDITLRPESALRSHLIPYLLITVIKGTDSHFNCSTRVTFEDDAIVPPFYIILSSTRIIVFSLIRPASIDATEDSEVPVNVSTTVDLGGGESYEEVGGWYLTLKLMPCILDEGIIKK